VIAGVGYVSGVGFEIGPGTYSPLASATVDLPGVPLLAAAPDHLGRSWIGLAFLAVPAVAGYLIARPVVKALAIRSDRLLAAGLASVLTGALVAVAAAVARGGIGDGRWSTIGAPPLLVGVVVAAEVGALALTVAGLAGGRAVPWQSAKVRGPRPATATGAVTVDPDAGVHDDLLAGEASHDEVPDEEPHIDQDPMDEALPDQNLLDEALPEDALDDQPATDAGTLGSDSATPAEDEPVAVTEQSAEVDDSTDEVVAVDEPAEDDSDRRP
jgi:hypothetical protein